MINVPVHFDDKSLLASEKVDNEVAEDLLTTKLYAQAFAAYGGPQERFTVSEIEAVVMSASFKELLTIGGYG